MKNQYFGDRRDFFKYELLLDLASCVKGRRLLLIPMLTANDSAREGSFIGFSRGSRRQLLFECVSTRLPQASVTSEHYGH